MTDTLPFIDLAAQQRLIGPQIDAAIRNVLAHGQYIMGPEVRELEAALGKFAGVSHVISCASGTDALVMVLMAWGIGQGDAVFVPSFTFCATAEAVVLVGATPVFCDVDAQDFTLSPQSLKRAIVKAREEGLKPRAVIPVDLFGHPADFASLTAIARENNLLVLDDAAQAFGATHHGVNVGALGDASATSFFPAKPLGCYGDGGAIFTHDAGLAEKLVSIRIHGQIENKAQARIEHVRIGLTGRLDTLQAAILLEKLKIFPAELEARDKISRHYAQALGLHVQVPQVRAGLSSAWAQYTIRLPKRDAVRAKLAKAGIPTAVYYALPLHRQPAYAPFPQADGLKITDELSLDVLSLPMHPYLTTDVIGRITDALSAAVK